METVRNPTPKGGRGATVTGFSTSSTVTRASPNWSMIAAFVVKCNLASAKERISEILSFDYIWHSALQQFSGK